MAEDLFVGIDLGTSGCRAVAITKTGKIAGWGNAPLPSPSRHGEAIEQNPKHWWQAVTQALSNLFHIAPPHLVKSLAIDGTSGTVLLVDTQGHPLTPAFLYNDSRSHTEAQIIAKYGSLTNGASGPTSGLAKLLHLQTYQEAGQAAHLVHQADWIASRLGAPLGVSDENNCLKSGYDPNKGEWPPWLDQVGVQRPLLPKKVVSPGTPIGTVNPIASEIFGLSPETLIVAGTTDSVAAFIATSAGKPGDAVTSLGSTLVLKVASDRPLFNSKLGIYSHRLGSLWLVGGASNSGGAVLRQYFTQAQLDEMTPHLKPDQPTGLNYYPLPSIGERFPISDPYYLSYLNPRPNNNLVFFQAMLEGIARIEAQGYRLLQTLGAPFPNLIRTTGGGAKNLPWIKIREQIIKTQVTIATETEAAYGSALLARQALLPTRY
ncbi:carbohydrate kinase [Candidatus Nitrosoglobus terrae]|uniref:Carbohydrate kinase n=1 Tax=Candidatus Nitrosoglobus terrae TaxID=1630141 RepID=A0A1Q2SMG7_9GAMM|nr:FGGY-family carbohydrate kinase [Candidatus Nitrosoglobus terrae]BAW80320.1 carbohydrate kinase [Candidatus Nitrosoglobus terrae]